MFNFIPLKEMYKKWFLRKKKKVVYISSWNGLTTDDAGICIPNCVGNSFYFSKGIKRVSFFLKVIKWDHLFHKKICLLPPTPLKKSSKTTRLLSFQKPIVVSCFMLKEKGDINMISFSLLPQGQEVVGRFER